MLIYELNEFELDVVSAGTKKDKGGHMPAKPEKPHVSVDVDVIKVSIEQEAFANAEGKGAEAIAYNEATVSIST